MSINSLLAFLIVGERLGPIQYVGFFVITAASAALSLRSWRKIRVNAAFWFMLLVAFILAWESVMFKFLFERGIGWGTAVAGQSVFSFAWAALLFAVPRVRRATVSYWSSFRSVAPLLAAEEFLTFFGSAAFTYAIFLVPVTFVETISSFQSFFVLLYALLFCKKFPGLFKEEVDRKSVLRKFALFAVMFAGVVLMVLSAK